MSSPSDRRPSGSFASLMGVKRNSQDESAQARRLSQTDHYQKPGFIGNLWNNWTKGPPPSASKPAAADAKPEAPRKQSIHRTGAGTLG